MDKEIIENISKVPSLNTKMEKIESLLKEENYKEAYQIVAKLIEIVCIDVLEEIHDKRVENSDIVNLGSLLEQYHEKELKEMLVAINGEYEFMQLDEVKEIDVLSLLGNLDDLVKTILEKYQDIF